MFYRVIRGLAKLLMHIWFKIEYYGEENIPVSGGFLLVANHVSNLDPVMLAIHLKRQICFMAKAELFGNPLFSAIFGGLGAFAVSRGAGETDKIEFGADLVREGKILGLFPEGTRSKTGELRRAKSGASMVAYKSGANILPAGISYPQGKGFRARVVVRYGALIPASELPVKTGSLPEIKQLSRLIMEQIGAQLEGALSEGGAR